MVDSLTGNPGIEELSPADCWTLLRGVNIGRIGIATDDGVDIFPVNFLVHDEAVYFRSAAGSKMLGLTARPRIAFEADGLTDRKRWSVVLKGIAERLSFDAEIEASGVLELVSLSPTEKLNFVRLTPSTITGRRFASTR